QDYAKKRQLSNVEFLGFVDISKLIDLYESCSVYVGCGNYEPWGMRLNDCLQCGAPLIVNRGMGGVKMVDEYNCGLSFNRGDYIGLANAMERLMTDKALYLQIAKNAIYAAEEIRPEKATVKYAAKIKKFIQ
ncbi:glycosyltransferase, partial [Parabacteroides merdae]|nr:glycosyltransferase [Parabacteroides merdae]